MARKNIKGVYLTAEQRPNIWASGGDCTHHVKVDNKRAVDIHNVTIFAKILLGYAEFSSDPSQILWSHALIAYGPPAVTEKEDLVAASGPGIDMIETTIEFTDATNLSSGVTERDTAPYDIGVP